MRAFWQMRKYMDEDLAIHWFTHLLMFTIICNSLLLIPFIRSSQHFTITLTTMISSLRHSIVTYHRSANVCCGTCVRQQCWCQQHRWNRLANWFQTLFKTVFIVLYWHLPSLSQSQQPSHSVSHVRCFHCRGGTGLQWALYYSIASLNAADKTQCSTLVHQCWTLSMLAVSVAELLLYWLLIT